MVQGQAARVPAQAGVWVEVKARARVEAGWADHLQQGRAETVCAQTAAIMFRTWWVSRATR